MSTVTTLLSILRDLRMLLCTDAHDGAAVADHSDPVRFVRVCAKCPI